MTEAMLHLGHHGATKHPALAGGGGLPRAPIKVEAWKRPKVALDTSKGDWCYFLSK